MRCPHCNSKLKKNTKFCPECGKTVIWEENTQTNGGKTGKGKLAIIVIAILVFIGVAAFLALDGTDWIKGIEDETVLKTTVSQIAFSDDPTAISAASQSVVKLNCYDKNGDLYATGSGFACFADNVIVTNYHVIEGGVYSIEASTEDGNTFDVTYVLATDEAKDIAFLGTSTPHNLALLQPGNSNDLQKGEKVVAIGSPLGLLNSVSTGVFSGYTDVNGMDVLQFTASISNGSSGGALFNDAGEVLGITFASYEAGQNLNLAIPISAVTRIWENRNNLQKLTIPQFYDTFPHVYAVDYVIANAAKLNGQELTIEGYVSYTFGYVYDGETIQSSALVTDVTNIIGSVFTLDNWDYSASNRTAHQETMNHTIELNFSADSDMQQFLDYYSPGNYIECTGTLRIVTLGDFVSYILYVQ